MKTIVTLFFAAFTLLISAQTVDLTNSSVVWTGKKVTGEHTGEISISKANLVFKQGYLIGGDFVLDMNSITCTDLEGKSQASLVAHLKNADFFATDLYKTAKLQFTEVKHIEGADYRVFADLTIKGITQPVVFIADLRNGVATATIKVDRTKYGIKYGSGSFFDDLGDKTIDDIFIVEVSLAYSEK